MSKQNNSSDNDYEIKILAEEDKEYDLPLISFSEDFFSFAFANLSRDKDGKPLVLVEDIASIEAKKMQLFLSVIIEAMVNYEEKYKNGYGLTKKEDYNNDNG